MGVWGLAVAQDDYEVVSFHMIDEAGARARPLYTKPLCSPPNCVTEHGEDRQLSIRESLRPSS